MTTVISLGYNMLYAIFVYTVTLSNKSVYYFYAFHQSQCLKFHSNEYLM